MTRGGKRPGAGRPHKYGEALRVIKVRLPESGVAKLDIESKKLEISRNELIIKKLGL